MQKSFPRHREPRTRSLPACGLPQVLVAQVLTTNRVEQWLLCTHLSLHCLAQTELASPVCTRLPFSVGLSKRNGGNLACLQAGSLYPSCSYQLWSLFPQELTHWGPGHCLSSRFLFLSYHLNVEKLPYCLICSSLIRTAAHQPPSSLSPSLPTKHIWQEVPSAKALD